MNPFTLIRPTCWLSSDSTSGSKSFQLIHLGSPARIDSTQCSIISTSWSGPNLGKSSTSRETTSNAAFVASSTRFSSCSTASVTWNRLSLVLLEWVIPSRTKCHSVNPSAPPIYDETKSTNSLVGIRSRISFSSSFFFCWPSLMTAAAMFGTILNSIYGTQSLTFNTFYAEHRTNSLIQAEISKIHETT